MNHSTAAPDERQLRIDLAAAFRIIAKLGMHEAVANHFSAAVSADGRKFLMNPKWRHFSRIKASDLVLFDLDDARGVKDRPDVDPTALAIHAQMHKQLTQAPLVMHLHPPFATTIASLADPSIKPVDHNTARYFNRLAIDGSDAGMADN